MFPLLRLGFELLIGGNVPIAHLIASALYLLELRHKCGGSAVFADGIGLALYEAVSEIHKHNVCSVQGTVCVSAFV